MAQAFSRFGEKAAQLIGGPGQYPQFILALAADLLGEAALAQLFDLADQVGDGGDQLGADQPTGQTTDQQRGAKHDQYRQPDGAQRGFTDALDFAGGVLVDLQHQLLQLITGVPIDTAHQIVTGNRIAACGHEALQTVTVIRAQRQMALLQGDHPLTKSRWQLQFSNLSQQVLHLLFAVLELLPVAIQIGLLAAAQQHIFPFLDLGLEGQVGLVDQPGGGLGAFHQQSVVAQLLGQRKYADQGYGQHQQQTADDQRQALPAQGRLECHQ